MVIFHTGEQEYALVVTGAQIILEQIDMKRIIREAMGFQDVGLPKAPPPLRPELIGPEMTEKLHDYWKTILDSSPTHPRLPGQQKREKGRVYRQGTYRAVIDGAFFAELNYRAKGNRLMLAAFLTTAWGFLMQNVGEIRDVCFCLAVPPKGGQHSISSGLFQMVPIRQKTSPDEILKDFVARQFRQLLASSSYACLSWAGFGKILGRNGKPFDYFLDFCGLLDETPPYSKQPARAEGNLVSTRFFDPTGMKLSIYFGHGANGMSVTFVYDESEFLPGSGRNLANMYLAAVRRMMTDINEKAEMFEARLKNDISGDENIREFNDESVAMRIQSAIYATPILQGKYEGLGKFFTKGARIDTYFEGDYIQWMDDMFLFVVQGTIYRSIQDSEGWYRPLDVMKAGTWLNETVLLEKRRAVIAAEVFSETAEVLAIPAETFQNALAGNPSLWKTIASHVLKRLETYQLLWSMS